MVPQKVIVEGFLCYGASQEVDLGGMRLCMLAGPNGSGKSTIFDAITFALFGQHRGGSRNLEDLINKKSDSARVTFEFVVDGRAWRIYRTIKRKRGGGAAATGEVRRPSAKGVEGEWDVVPDTSSERGLTNWVESTLALSGKAFLRSMLLRQGESDRLLSSEPRERFEVLAGVADLEKYQALERSANDRRRAAEAELKQLDAQAAGAPEIGDEEVSAAEREARDAAGRVETADKTIGSLQELHARAKQWVEAKAKLDDAVAKRDAARGLVGDASAIEAADRRLTSLTTALPHLSVVAERRRRIERSKEEVRKLSGRQEEQRRLLDVVEGKSNEARTAIDALEPLVPELEEVERKVASRIAGLRRTLDAADATEKQRASLARAEGELKRIETKHPRSESELGQARREADRLTELSAALPTLERFADARRELSGAVARRAEAEESKRTFAGRSEELTRERADSKRALEAAGAAAEEAQRKEAEVAGDLKRAKAALAALDGAEGRADCPTCGQQLTESHLAEERRRRAEDAARLTDLKAVATKAHQECKARVKQLTDADAKLAGRERDLADRTRDAATAAAQSGKEIERSSRACSTSYAALPEELRRRVAPAPVEDWAATAWPSGEDVAALGDDARKRAAAGKRVDELDAVCVEWRRWTAEAAAHREALAAQAVAVPDDVATLRAEAVAVEKQTADVGQRLKESRDALRRHQKALGKLSEEAGSIGREIARLSSSCGVEAANQASSDEAIRQAIGQLDEEWSGCAAGAFAAEELAAWEAETGELGRRGVRESFERLADARANLSALDRRVAELEADLGSVPEAARRPPEAVGDELEIARASRERNDRARREAEARHARLQDEQRRRRELTQARRRAAGRARQLNALCELLGKKRLQRHLVRRTERRIVECANHVLERLSDGGMRLQLREGDDGDDVAEEALDLVVIKNSPGGGGAVVHGVAFLSGSQRFRVAVSLALAIGQVAGDRSCGECVIIDEGFGSLDAAGQDVMIAELRRLQGIMKRIVLVSHQESFADAFPDGYRFAIHDGETRVERMSS